MHLPKRKRIRLKYYDYSSNGAYFITICTKDRQLLLWKAKDADNDLTFGEFELSPIGTIIDAEINKIPSIYNNVKIDKYVIMPNHIHIILVLFAANKKNQAKVNLPRIIKQFKGSITKQVGFTIWQKSYYDHVIRNDQEYQEIWQYIDTNPQKWQSDCYYQK